MRTASGLRKGQAEGARWQSVNFTYTSPLICPLTGQGSTAEQVGEVEGLTGVLAVGLPVIICHYKTTQQKGENPITSLKHEGWDCTLKN